MTSEQLANRVAAIIGHCTTRIKGIGAEQYDKGKTQGFETMPLCELIDWAGEELEDIIVYAAMLHIRLNRIKEELKSDVNHKCCPSAVQLRPKDRLLCGDCSCGDEG